MTLSLAATLDLEQSRRVGFGFPPLLTQVDHKEQEEAERAENKDEGEGDPPHPKTEGSPGCAAEHSQLKILVLQKMGRPGRTFNSHPYNYIHYTTKPHLRLLFGLVPIMSSGTSLQKVQSNAGKASKPGDKGDGNGDKEVTNASQCCQSQNLINTIVQY